MRSLKRPNRKTSGGMWLFYAFWLAVCLLSFITSTLLGFVTIALGVLIRLSELNLHAQREVLLELRAHRRGQALAGVRPAALEARIEPQTPVAFTAWRAGRPSRSR